MKRNAIWILILLGGLLAAAPPLGAQNFLRVADVPKAPPEADMEVREFAELVLKDNTAKTWKGAFRMTPLGQFEVTPNGALIFDVMEGEFKGMSLRVHPRDIQKYNPPQSKEAVFHKTYKKLPTGRLDVPKYINGSRECVKEGFYDLAEELLRKALKIDPQSLEVYYELGSLLRARLKLNEELLVYEAGLKEKLPRPEGLIARLAGYLEIIGLHAE
ncbi:MAG: hypothetical protein ACYTHM_03755, partial [Planctomycetota bacterium]